MAPFSSTAIALGTVLGASLAGSAHCLGMCGPLVMAVAPTRATRLLYHAGRFVSYASLGAAAGALGKNSLFSNNATIEIVSALLFASALLLTAFKILGFWKGVSAPGLWPKLSKFAFAASPEKFKPLILGALSAFLPCGWLYTYVLAATSTGTAMSGAVLMMVFWVGTVPILTAAPWGIQRLLKPISNRFPKASAVLLIGAALSMVGFKTMHVLRAETGATGEPKSCHGGG